MRLTNIIRDAFVRAAMDDVPQVDYYEQLRKLITEDAVSQLPPKVRAIYNDKALRQHLNHEYAYRYHGNFNIPTTDRNFRLSDAAKSIYDKTKEANDAQQTRRAELRSKLKSCAYAVATREALVKLLPEFEKYLPADEEKAIRTLPVVANVVADFVKAGWPKGVAKTKTAKGVPA
jgi:hypothetical protein